MNPVFMVFIFCLPYYGLSILDMETIEKTVLIKP